MLCMTLPVPLAVEPDYAVFAMGLGFVMLAVGRGEEPAGNVVGPGEKERVRAAAERERSNAPLAVELA